MNGKRPDFKLLTLQQSLWAHVVVVALIFVPWAIASFHPAEIYEAYVREFVGPKVRREFGFGMSRKRMHYYAQPVDVFFITPVEPTGVLAKAGVRANDVPVGMYHMSDVGFYDELRRSRKEDVEIRVVVGDVYEGMIREGNIEPSWGCARRLTIPKRVEARRRAPCGLSRRRGARRLRP